MNTKKIIDYIVVSKSNEYTSFSERINDKITSLEAKIIENEGVLEQQTRQIAFYEALKIEFTDLKLFKVDETYDTNASFSMDNWIGGLKYKHPLAPYNAWKKEKTITLIDIKNINNNYDEITRKLKEQIALNKKVKEELLTLNNDLQEFKNNPDPIVNKNSRSSFEKEIFNLLEKGYELQGGVTFSKDLLYQAMVKYE